MAVTVQIRNVPDDVHRKLKARAALAGMSISEYLLRELERSFLRFHPGGATGAASEPRQSGSGRVRGGSGRSGARRPVILRAPGHSARVEVF